MVSSLSKEVIRQARKRLRLNKNQKTKAGLAPGTLIYVGEPRDDAPRLSLITYDKEKISVHDDLPVVGMRAPAEATYVSWINLDGIHQPELVGELGALFDIHALTLEDIVNTNQRPKLEEWPNYLYLVLKMIYRNSNDDQVRIEQISIILTDKHLLTFQEQSEDVFFNVRERLKNSASRLRKLKPDYLLFSLMDSVIDHYFVILERLEDRIDELEIRVYEDPSSKTFAEIQELKRELMFLRRIFLPLREVINQLSRIDNPLINAKARVYFKDIYDKMVHAVESVEIMRDLLAGLQDLHLSLNGQRMNEIMKVLTIIATIFIPLTFIAGIYGMNFQHMPELQWEWGYFAAWGLMLVIGVALILYFRRKNWF